MNRDAIALPTPVAGYPKRLANVTAQLALRGFELHPLDGDALMVSRWGTWRVLKDIEAAEQFIEQIGG